MKKPPVYAGRQGQRLIAPGRWVGASNGRPYLLEEVGETGMDGKPLLRRTWL